MSKHLRKVSIAVLGIAGAVAAAGGAGLLLADRRAQRVVETPILGSLTLSSDAQVLAQGAYLYRSRGCASCHGSQGEGRVFADGGGMFARGSNLTSGKNGIATAYNLRDWDRAIRHGVSRTGRPLLIMPSEDFNRLTDPDTSALVSYIATLPPVDGEFGEVRFPLPARVMYGFGRIPDAASRIDHTKAPATVAAKAVTLEYGAYVAQMCVGCHRADLSGGKVETGPPNWPAAPDIRPSSPTSAIKAYPTVASLQAMFKSGRRADGTKIQAMPFGALKEMDEVEVGALHLYLTGASTPSK